MSISPIPTDDSSSCFTRWLCGVDTTHCKTLKERTKLVSHDIDLDLGPLNKFQTEGALSDDAKKMFKEKFEIALTSINENLSFLKTKLDKYENHKSWCGISQKTATGNTIKYCSYAGLGLGPLAAIIGQSNNQTTSNDSTASTGGIVVFFGIALSLVGFAMNGIKDKATTKKIEASQLKEMLRKNNEMHTNVETFLNFLQPDISVTNISATNLQRYDRLPDRLKAMIPRALVEEARIRLTPIENNRNLVSPRKFSNNASPKIPPSIAELSLIHVRSQHSSIAISPSDLVEDARTRLSTIENLASPKGDDIRPSPVELSLIRFHLENDLDLATIETS